MKKIINLFLICCLFVIISCDSQLIDDQKIPEVYNGFYNYPIGRVDPSGTLTVQNMVATKVLLFNGTVEGNNFLGIVDSLSSVKIKLPEEKFYSIVTVDASTYEEKTYQASQTSKFTYYSNVQPYYVSVTTSGTYGAGSLIVNNSTSYWVTIKTSDLSQNIAVIAPTASRVSIPIEMNKSIDYKVFFTKEISYNGKTIAVIETTDPNMSGTVFLTSESPNYTLSIKNETGLSTSIMLKPSVLVKNNTTAPFTIYCLDGGNYLSNGAETLGNFALTSGNQQLFVGFDDGDRLDTLNFENMAWNDTGKGNLYMTDETILKNGKVYIVEVKDNRICHLVDIQDAVEFFEENK